ncbi:TlpA disulfide reductase family protein [Anaerotignum sp.]|uniref:TlpA disulfide reductase family protein n=1 Tax=Anaerotignum sp. TaxID=2039241 RepID=UPI0028AD15A0|nr:TlpA disulfide reductase family protein [Anaerotignum sp.]
MKKKGYLFLGIILVLLFFATLYNYLGRDEGTAIGPITFQSINLEGKPVENEIFQDYDLTMVNIWATYCIHCGKSMSEMERLYGEMQEQGVNVIGIVSDVCYPVRSMEVYEAAVKMAEDAGVSFQNVLPDKSLQTKLLNRMPAVPVTFFVDNEGNIVGEMIVGAQSKLEYKKRIQNLVETLKEGE